MNQKFFRSLLFSLMTCVILTDARADWRTIYEAGIDDESYFSDFSAQDGAANPPPGSATNHNDDDTYLAGLYPPPIGSVSGNELGLSQGGKECLAVSYLLGGVESTRRIHFILNASEARPTAQLRLLIDLALLNYISHSVTQLNGYHNLSVKLNGFPVAEFNNVTDPGILIKTVSLQPGVIRTGENVIEYQRTGGTPGGYVYFDRLKAELNPAADLDADGDGIPQQWEEDHGLNDHNPSDAFQDVDGDGLNAFQEWLNGTHPFRSDTDGDGLSDGVEAGLPTGTSPILKDSDEDSIPDGQEPSLLAALSPDADGDGSPDTWEIRQGSLPLVAGDGAPVLNGILGVKVNVAARPGREMERYRINGVVPQMAWNNTYPLSRNSRLPGSLPDIASPVTGQLVDGAGNTTSVGISWTGVTAGMTGNPDNAAGRITDGMLRAASWSPATISFNNIPWGRYDVYAYVGGTTPYLDSAVRLNNDSATDRWLDAISREPSGGFFEGTSIDRGSAKRANYVRFRNVSGSTCSITMLTGSDTTCGLTAVQLVDVTADRDGDGIPDWYEAEYRLDSRRNDAIGDADSDGLTNFQEYGRGTDPRSSDTDHDGLSDFMESGSGIYRGPSDPGTSPLLADTDGDGLGDGDEIHGGPFFSHPLFADSDLDGASDLAERLAKTNPLSSAVTLRKIPTRNPDTGAWTWVIDNVQILINHRTGGSTLATTSRDRLCSFGLKNATGALSDAHWRFSLDQQAEGLFWRVETGHGVFEDTSTFFEQGFTAQGNDSGRLSGKLGFAGLGEYDISDRLRFKMELLPPGVGESAWKLRVRCFNLDTDSDVPVVDVVSGNGLPHPSMNSNTVVWTSSAPVPVFSQYEVTSRSGVTVYFSRTRLDETPAFAFTLDSDNDGLPDQWENTYGGNPADPGDALLDTDGDGLNDWREFAAGTRPDLGDSDGDGAPDGAEVAAFSDPLNAASTPFPGRGLATMGRNGDFDQNGLPDVWESVFQTHGLTAQADPDGDGLNNIQEAAAGTNPLQAASAFSTEISMTSDGKIRLDWKGSAYKKYSIQSANSPGSWTVPPAVIHGPDSANGFYSEPARPGSLSRNFYRVQASDIDSDGDGVNDWTENQLGTNPAQPSSAGSSQPVDADGDGSPEGSVSGDLAYLSNLSGSLNPGADPSANPLGVSPALAARFLTQATFGPTPSEIQRVQAMGYEAWINDQITQQPAYYHSSYIHELSDDLAGARLRHSYPLKDEFTSLPSLNPENLHTPFLRAALQKPDQLRQRLAYALSQIFVVSRRDPSLNGRLEGLANYYDIFVRNSLGNFRNILSEVARHPVMGVYLSHIGNQKAKPEISQFPDENFAREIMQLFTIGLWELNPDGTRRKDQRGNDIPTYGNAEITEMARVFTGFYFAGYDWGQGGYLPEDYTQPMDIHSQRHDFERKILLRGTVIPVREPSREAALQDFEDAIDCLFHHPNTPPFICRQLIQFFVTSNPSPGFVRRIQDVFVNDGQGQRGNLSAVIRAILLDAEARTPAVLPGTAESGQLREPLLRYTALARAFGAAKNDLDLIWWDGDSFNIFVQQKPLYAPTVFNFYRPDYRPPGILSDKKLSGPVFQITNSSTSISFPNIVWFWIEYGISQWGFPQFPLDISNELTLAADPPRLLDRVNLLLCQGLMSPATRDSILAAVKKIPVDRAATRVRLAIFLAACSPDGTVLR